MKKKILSILIAVVLVFGTLGLVGCIGNNYTITIEINNSDYGVVVGAGSYNKNEDATITAVANDGHFFSHWEDGSLDATRIITDKTDKTYKAIFYKGNGETVKFNNHFVTAINGNIEETNLGISVYANNVNDFGYWWIENDQTVYSTYINIKLREEDVDKDLVFTAEDTSCGIWFFTTNENNTFDGLEKTNIEDALYLTNHIYDKVSANGAIGVFTKTSENVFLNGRYYTTYLFERPIDKQYLHTIRSFTIKGGYEEIIGSISTGYINSGITVTYTIRLTETKGAIINYKL